MRIPFVSIFITSPFEGLMEHAEKVKDTAWAFQRAFRCFTSRECQEFEELRRAVNTLENEADAIKRRIRGHLPKGTLLPIDKFQLFRYLREQDHVLDALRDALDWISYREEYEIPPGLQKDFALLVETVVEPIEQLNRMVAEARVYFGNFSEKQRVLVKNIIRTIRQQEHQVDQVEKLLIHKIFRLDSDPVTIFHLIRLVKIIGSVADHAENAGDMMRAMLAR